MENLKIIFDAMPQLLHGLVFTIQYSILGVLFASVIGLIAAFMKLSSLRILRLISNIYVEIFRGTPLLVQILFIYSGLPLVLPLHKWFGEGYLLVAATCALAFNEGAYITEIIRAGILSIDRGQKEAAQSIGMNGFQTMFYIILPQAFKRMIPPLVNQFAQTIKDTSLLSVISVAELIYAGEIIIAQTFQAFQIWAGVAILYFILIFALTRFAAYLERRLQIDRR
ncbi:amino acid ABC transporter permease [Fodinisporobacter ferrooxydans]|uniref:Amino acid ABC transporter permease n=1 Tax=Fodinisporobacter ferrooxydans TaxID=2901836 RepID=A0ABY4CTA5_9BACL|nr:amino acid ABC transporter permease [Alicyclobacillaceae bacterium MYW30-H2]